MIRCHAMHHSKMAAIILQGERGIMREVAVQSGMQIFSLFSGSLSLRIWDNYDYAI